MGFVLNSVVLHCSVLSRCAMSNCPSIFICPIINNIRLLEFCDKNQIVKLRHEDMYIIFLETCTYANRSKQKLPFRVSAVLLNETANMLSVFHFIFSTCSIDHFLTRDATQSAVCHSISSVRPSVCPSVCNIQVP